MTAHGTGTVLIHLTASAVRGIGAGIGIHGTGTHGHTLHGTTATHGTALGIQAFTTLGSMTLGCTVSADGMAMADGMVSMVRIIVDGTVHGIRSGRDIITGLIRATFLSTKTSGEAQDIRRVRTRYLQEGLQAAADSEHLRPHAGISLLQTAGHCPKVLQSEAQEPSGQQEATGAQQLQRQAEQESEAQLSEVLSRLKAGLHHRFHAAAITADRLQHPLPAAVLHMAEEQPHLLQEAV